MLNKLFLSKSIHHINNVDFTVNYYEFPKHIYNNLDREHRDLSNYSNHCNTITWGRNGDEVKKICKKYITYLETSQIIKVKNTQYDVCVLLNYWIYEKLNEIFRDEESSEDIKIAFGNLQLVWNQLYNYSSRINHNNCNPKFEMVNHHDWEKRKKLYDYYVDYKELVFLAQNHDKQCKYYNKIKEKISLYDHFSKPCTSRGSECPHFYDDCKSYNPNLVLSKLPCYTQMEKMVLAYDNLQTILIPS
ncbi:hypothetical protein PVBG_05555 [Plasmodium vivax Brazil I]|uniref:PIR Superfamily Protein n=1 Tax=Plasmodium vivax (strain Brazil I) TaxID=1033975 RepID=A0A0J9T0Q1_PLAV1|nr:hypothetical protein PVBG_05555 [Plasmodium vivax Brazil I]